MTRTSARVGAMALGLALVAAAANAAPLLIVNAGFEEPALADSGAIFSVAGWLNSGDSGTFDPDAAAFATGAPEGENVAFAGFGSAAIWQVLTSTAEANTLYTLTVLVGNRLDAAFVGYQTELWAGATMLARDDSSLLPADGAFALSTVNYFVAAGHAAIGSPLEIRLISPGHQAIFDDVKLDATEPRPVPEPGLLALLALGGASLAARRRRA